MNLFSTEPQKHRRIQLNLTPMIDMVFLLLIFFMLTTSFVRDEGLTLEFVAPDTEARAPVAGVVNLPAPQEGALDLMVRTDGSVLMPTQDSYTMAELPAVMRSWCSEHPKVQIFIRNEDGVNVQQIIDVMDTVRQAGGQHVVLMPRKGQKLSAITLW